MIYKKFYLLLVFFLCNCGFIGLQYNTDFKTEDYKKYLDVERPHNSVGKGVTECGGTFMIGFIIPLPVVLFNKCSPVMHTSVKSETIKKAILVYNGEKIHSFSSNNYIAFKDVDIKELKKSANAKIIIMENDGKIVELPFRWKMVWKLFFING